MKICAATGNAGKLRELRRILEALGHEVVSQKELDIDLEPEETGTTFVENARIKADAVCAASGLPTIADDSGLCVEALGGAPGVYSARYCGRHGDDEANNDKLLEALREIPAEQRHAKFVSAVCLTLPSGQHLTCTGECPGRIAEQRMPGDHGFGYDPLFIPDECGVGRTSKRLNSEGRSYAQLTPEEKDAISHRGRALAVLEDALDAFLSQIRTGAVEDIPVEEV
ncbi:MAG: RdgB/HAM1 family non-canonical purine NTP pyrophosphatase [Faecalibacterium sp.]